MSKDRIRIFLLLLLLLLLIIIIQPSGGLSAEIYATVPEKIDAGKKYLFYLHGLWIEMHGLNARHPIHGLYEYDRIVRVLSEKGFVVVSEVRTHEVGMMEYASEIATQVLTLMERGVPAEHISVIGHSKGGHMALIVATLCEDPKLNFVVMAGCGKQGSAFRRPYDRFLTTSAANLEGRVLSLYDGSDPEAGTCQEAFALASYAKTKERVFRTGRGHGLFYSPDASWINEVVSWAETS